LVVKSEITKPLEPDGILELSLKKTEQKALGKPFTSCDKNSTVYIDPTGVSYNYRQANCIDRCNKNKTIDCKAICPLECDQTSFDITRLTLNKPLRPDDLAKCRQKLKGKIPEMTDSELNLRSLVLFVYFERLEYTMITQTPSMTVIDLVSSIGGLMGNKNFFFILTNINYFFIERSLSWSEFSVFCGNF